MSDRIVVLEMARIEAAHLAGLVSQFAELLDESDDAAADPALQRLVPDAYADAESAREFREVTETELLGRRRADGAVVLASLADAAQIPDDPDDPRLVAIVEIALDDEQTRAWLRTLAAVRLVLATRLGVTQEDDHDADDPRFGIYDWLGYRLDGLVAAIDAG
jgi:hypothetical protein